MSPDSPDLDALVARLSLAQKVRLLTGVDWWTTPPEPAVGLRAMVLSDGPVGVRGTVHDGSDPSALLPSATAIAASWDEQRVALLAGLLGGEARRKGADVVLGPTVNLHRSPLGGRHFECYSEDPLLTARLGAAYVRALQSMGVAATPKHYVANDSENERFTVDVRATERALREVYLRPFEDLVAAGAWLVMAAYNSLGGTTLTEHPLLDEPLKGEWGFDGVVVSDWFAARSTVAAGNAGLDLVMPADSSPWGDDLVAAVRAGRVPEAAVDAKVRRVLRLATRVGALGKVGSEGGASAAGASVLPGPPPDDPGIGESLRAAAADGAVLLSNPDGVLPLVPEALGSVAVIGPLAAEPRAQGGGSAEVHPPYAVSPLAGLRAALAGQAEVVHVPGTRLVSGLAAVRPPLAHHPRTGAPGLLVELLDAGGAVLRSLDRHSGNLRLTSADLPPGTTLLRATTRLRADEPGQWRLGFAGIGDFALTVDGEQVLAETVMPDDISPVSAFADPPQRSADRTLAAGDEVELVLTYVVFEGMPATMCVLGCERPAADPEAARAAAADAARTADAAVVMVGTTERGETEGMDRSSLALPGDQDELVRAVAAANPRTVVVVNAGAPVLLPWRDEVAAVLLAWFGGQEMGNALADVLLGQAEPGGRLPTTWPAAEADVPVLDTTPVDGVLSYHEGIHIGYRGWLRSAAAPAYPFGHGLGYTTWEYESLRVEGTVVRVRVRNTGARAGKEVVQAYLSRPDSAVERPVRWLAGFAVVRADPGEVVTLDVPLDRRSFAHWTDGGWEVEPGEFTLAVGRSVRDLPLHAQVTPDG